MPRTCDCFCHPHTQWGPDQDWQAQRDNHPECACFCCGSFRPVPITKHEQTWDELEGFLATFAYTDFSRFRLEREDENNYAVFCAFIHAPNSRSGEPGNRPDRYTRHEFVVPVATYNRKNWRRWVYEQLRRIATHEVDEWFLDDGERVFGPHHGNGEDPYVSWQLDTANQIAKSPGDS